MRAWLVAIALLSCREDSSAPTRPAPTIPPSSPPYVFPEGGPFGVRIGDDEEDLSSMMALLGVASVPNDFLLVCGGVRIDADGKATLTKGGATKTLMIDPAAMGALVARLDQHHFFALADDYGVGPPTITITVTMNGQTKSIRNHMGDILHPAQDADYPFVGERKHVFDIESAINTAVEFADGGKMHRKN